MTDNETTPTQADRDAAADLIEAQYVARGYAAGSLQTPEETRRGERDHCPEVKAFAAYRHRLASTLPTPEPSEVGELIERLRRKVQVMPPIGGGSISADGTSTCYITDDGKRLVNPDGPEAADTLATMQERVGVLEALGKALLAVVNATRAYLPPDGIDTQECINRILAATDNPEINPIIREIEHGRS